MVNFVQPPLHTLDSFPHHPLISTSHILENVDMNNKQPCRHFDKKNRYCRKMFLPKVNPNLVGLGGDILFLTNFFMETNPSFRGGNSLMLLRLFHLWKKQCKTRNISNLFSYPKRHGSLKHCVLNQRYLLAKRRFIF